MRLTWWEPENLVKAIAYPETTDDARDILLFCVRRHIHGG